MLFCQLRPHSVQPSMEEKMCQQTKSFSKPSQTNYLYRQSSHRSTSCHQCNMCSSFSSSPLSTASGSSSSSTSSLSTSSAPMLSTNNDIRYSRRLSQQSFDKKAGGGCFIQQHLQSMFGLLRREETLKMAVRLESAHPGRTRYLVVVSRIGKNQSEECCLLGIDCNQCTTVGLVLKVLADTAITLDGDGGFSVSVCGHQHIFKPVSVQAMWSALQTLYKVSNKARECNYFEGGNTHEWVAYYEQSIESDRSCLNEWHTMNDIESRRPPSPDSLRSKPRERLETERIIRSTLKEIMMSVDLDQVTSKYIRSRLEEQLDMDLREFKSFIDQEMLVILGQMDEATEVFSHVYLGSEWNASNLEELNKNGIRHILNVTREIDNFFPGTFDYMNVRVYDDDNTDLLKHWDNTYKYIDKVKNKNSKVLVHCKMGISRSASVVIAYAMKAYGWDFRKAFEYVQKKRSCIKPNQNFLNQLETYQGMLDAMKNKEKLQRSKSETNLKSTITKTRFHAYKKKKREEHNTHTRAVDAQVNKTEKSNQRSETDYPMLRVCSGVELAQLSMRPKSWSPDNLIASEIFCSSGNMSQSLEHLNICKLNVDSHSSSASSLSTSPPHIPPAPPLPPADSRYNLNVGMHCENGLTYSVSQNKIVQLYSAQNQSNQNAESKDTVAVGGIRKNDALSNPNTSFTLQLPSQFQGNAAMFSKQGHNANNLVTKDILDLGVDATAPNAEAPQPSAVVPPKRDRDSFGPPLRTFTQSQQQRKRTSECIVDRKTSRKACADTVVCYQNSAQSAQQLCRRPQDVAKPRLPFDLSESAVQKTAECHSQANTFNNNNDQAIKIFTSHSTNSLSVVEKNATAYNATTTTTTTQFSTVKYRTNILEQLKHPQSARDSGVANLPQAEKEDDTKGGGKVLNLTKEFEAKCNVFDRSKQRKRRPALEDNNNNDDARSLPCSPVNEPTSAKSAGVGRAAPPPPLTNSSMEDLSVRKLVGKYEVAKCNKERSKSERKQQPPIPPRNSSLDIGLAQTKVGPPGKYGGSGHRVPPMMKFLGNTSNEVRTTIAKANPLSKFTFYKQRNNPPPPPPPVFNTM